MLIMTRLPVVLLFLMALPLSQAIVIESDDTVQEMTTDKPGNSESGDSYTGLESGQGSGDSSRQDDLESGDSSQSDDLESGDSSDLESGDSSDLESGDSSGLESGDSSDLESGDSSGLESGDSSDLESGDSSDLEYGSGSKSGHVEVPKRHPLEWVEHTRGGDTIFADHSDIESISEFVNSSPTASSTCYTSQRPKVAYDDGPLNTVNSDNDEGTRHKRLSPPVFNCRKKTQGVCHHPEYAVGLLDNGCTAFLVGPHHAMTSARCVYDQRRKSWKEDLDFWRGRNSSGYLQRMEWEQVIIPRLFFDRAHISNDWAIITFNSFQPASPVWVPFGFCEGKTSGFSKEVLTYGYLPYAKDNMLFSRCQAGRLEFSIRCWCRYGTQIFNGGPILNPYDPDLKYSKQNLTPVIGLLSPRRDYCPIQGALFFHSDMFWSACFLLSKNGFNADCQKFFDLPPEEKPNL